MTSQTSETDILFMKRAVSLARLGLANTSPNPRVGAVIVHNGKIIGEGFHRKIGEGHAEVNAIASVKPGDMALLCQSTIYVTLEPCSHYGKTPPCAKLIIDKGIRHVVVGSTDPSPKVNGKGIKMLEDAGIKVTVLDGEISQICRDLNPEFNCRYINHRPFITLKWAETADGYMADSTGNSLAISTPITQTLVHRLRARHDVILTTSSTVIADNPIMNTRLWDTQNTPLRAVIDRNGKISSDARIFAGDDRQTLYYTLKHRNDLHNVEQILLPQDSSEQIKFIVDDIYHRGLNSILIEAGPTFLSSVIETGLYDIIRVERSSKSIGSSPVVAPIIPDNVHFKKSADADGNTITVYSK